MTIESTNFIFLCDLNEDVLERILRLIGNYYYIAKIAQTSKGLYRLSYDVQIICASYEAITLSQIHDKMVCVPPRGQIKWKPSCTIPPSRYLTILLGSTEDPLILQTIFPGVSTISLLVSLSPSSNKYMQNFLHAIRCATNRGDVFDVISNDQLSQQYTYWIECACYTKFYHPNCSNKPNISNINIPSQQRCDTSLREFLRVLEKRRRFYGSVELRLSRMSPFSWGCVNMIAKDLFLTF